MAGDRVRLLQVGLGFWGANWALEVLPTVGEVETVGYVDPDAAAVARLGAELGVPPERCFASLAAALARVECDAVLASLPTAFHAAVARDALRAGKHVLVEKPFTATLAEAVELVRLAEARARFLMVSQNYRFYPAAIAAADLVAGGALGRPLAVAIDFRRYGPGEGYRYWDIPDPLLADMSIHHFDLLRMVLGLEPLEVSCRTWNPPGSPFRSDPAGAAAIAFAGDVNVSYRGSWVSRGPRTPWSGEWLMELEDGAVFWAGRGDIAERLTADRLAVRRLGRATEPRSLAPLERYDRAGVLGAFARAILDGVAPPRFSSGRDNVGSLALVEACRRSAARRGEPVRIEEVLPPGFAAGGGAAAEQGERG
ncbi:MAG TPA: Gfo/Idh/MocA family oxidoreductase [Geminicoccaceae bacterium]|nr:Gfo/Idh/MocA family oxidoreductase [Geminicoccaceae bacterium]